MRGSCRCAVRCAVRGGTDINQAIACRQTLVTRLRNTVLVLITDLEEGGASARMLQRIANLVASGAALICLLDLSDEGQLFYDHEMAARFMALGVPAFACTPDIFPDLTAAAIERRDLSQWASLQRPQQ